MRLRNVLIALPAIVILSACTPASRPQAPTPTGPSGSAVAPPSGSPTGTTAASASVLPKQPAAKPVHVSLLESDGGRYGVGMPIIAWFNRAPTDGTAFAKATTVTVNGSRVQGAWFFEKTSHAGSALEGHFRTRTYWPAYASIQLNLPVKGLSAGPGLAFNDSLTLSIVTGAAHISTVDAHTLRMTVRSDGKVYGVFPVSLGARKTPTLRGTKVIDIPMRGPGYYDAHVKRTQRLTYGGEYLHAAPWNVKNLGVRSTSNGCTNLSPAVAQKLYGLFGIGDVVLYPNASGPAMRLGSGYGDWNVDWSTWLTGGALRT